MKNIIVFLTGVLFLFSCAHTVKRRVKMLDDRTTVIRDLDPLHQTGDTIYVVNDILAIKTQGVVLSKHVCSDSSHIFCDGECECDGMECNNQ